MPTLFRWTVLKQYDGAIFIQDLINKSTGKKGIWFGYGKDQIIALHNYFTLEELEGSVGLHQGLTKQKNEEQAKLITIEKTIIDTAQAPSVDPAEIDTLKNQLSSMADIMLQMQSMLREKQQVIYSDPPPQIISQNDPMQSDMLKQILQLVKTGSGSNIPTGFTELNSDEIAIKLLGQHAADITSNFTDIGKEETIETNAADVAKGLENIDFEMEE